MGYAGGSNSSANVTKEIKFVKARELVVAASTTETVKDEKKKNVANQWMLNKPCNQSVVRIKAKRKSLHKSQRGPRVQHFCHYCGKQGHTRPNCHKLRALKNASDQRSKGPKNDKRNWAAEQLRGQDGDSDVMDVMKMIDAVTTCLASFSRRFEGHNTRTQSYRDITPNERVVWVKRGTHA